jgi:hypothetical protein
MHGSAVLLGLQVRNTEGTVAGIGVFPFFFQADGGVLMLISHISAQFKMIFFEHLTSVQADVPSGGVGA